MYASFASSFSHIWAMLFVADMVISSGISDGCRVVDLELETLGSGVISLLNASTPSKEEKI